MACSSVLTAFAVATLLAIVATQVHSVAVTTNGWSQSGGDAQNTGRFRGQLSLDDGIQWAYDTGEAIAATALISPNQQSVYVIDKEATLYAVSMPQGEPSVWRSLFRGVRSPALLWQYATSSPTTKSAPAMLSDGSMIFVADGNGIVHAVRASDGTLAWQAQLGPAITTDVIVSPNDLWLFVGTTSNLLFSISTATGHVEWSCEANGEIAGSVAVSVDSSTLFFGTADATLYGISTTNNTCKHKVGTAQCSTRSSHSGTSVGCANWWVSLDGSPITAPPVLDTSMGLLYVSTTTGDQKGTLYAVQLNEEDPTKPPAAEAAAFVLHGAAITSSAAIVAPHVTAFGGGDGRLHAVNMSAVPPYQVWSHDSTGATVPSTPVSNGDYLAYGSTNMEVYVLDATTGVEQARIDVGGPVLAQVAVAAAGTMVVGDNAGTLWCLGGSSPNILLARLIAAAVGLALLVTCCCCLCYRPWRRSKPRPALRLSVSSSNLLGVSLRASPEPRGFDQMGIDASYR